MKKLIIKSPKYGKHTVLYDDEDNDLISKYTWHVNYRNNNVYAITSIKIKGVRKDVKMHRLILGLHRKSKPHIDHRDWNGLNNQKNNLRKATHSQNQQNSMFQTLTRNTTGYRGVYLYPLGTPHAGKYTATLKTNGKKIFGGYFKTAHKAAKRYNELAIKHQGEFAILNRL